MRPLNLDMIYGYRQNIPIQINNSEHRNDWMKEYARMLQVKDRDIKIQKIKDKLILKNMRSELNNEISNNTR